VRGAPLLPLPKHCKSAVSRWSDARGPSETSDWPIYRHVEPPHCRKHCRLAPILSGQSLPTLPHGGRGTTAGTAVATLPPPRTPPRATLPKSVDSLGPDTANTSRHCHWHTASTLPLGQSDVSDGPRASDHRDTADLQCFGSGGSGALTSYEAGSAYGMQPYMRSNARAVDRSLALKIRYSVSDGPRGHCTWVSVLRVGHISRQFNRTSSRSS